MQRLAVTATFILSLVSLSGCNGGGGSPAPGRPAPTASAAGPSLNFSEPPVVQSSGGVASVTLSALLAEGLTPSYAWDSGTGLVAPTIEVNPGDQIQLKLFNNLPPAADKLAMGLPDETNIHFHGLTSSPIAPGDDSIDAVEPGFSTTYDVTVNPDQPPGAYWYHAHPHGEAAYQVGYGMSGAIIIDGIENEVPDVAGLRQRLLIVRQHFTTGVTDRRRALAARYCGLNRLPPAQRAAFLNNLASEPRPAAGSAPVPLTVNNIDSSTVAIGIKPGERELFRVVNASVGRYLDLAVDGETLELVSQDGVPLRDFSGSAASETVPDIVVPPSGRAEFVVTGQGAPTTLRTLPFDSGPVGDPDPGDVIGMLVNDNGTSSNWRVPAAKKHRPTLHPSAYRDPLPPPSASHTIEFQENSTQTVYYLNGVTYDPSAPPAITSHVGTVELWTLENETDEVHDFHIHQVHFVATSVNGVAVPASQQHWRDTFNLPPQIHNADGTTSPSVTTVLIDFRDPVIRGTFLYHCHIIDHEDAGMMAKIQVM